MISNFEVDRDKDSNKSSSNASDEEIISPGITENKPIQLPQLPSQRVNAKSEADAAKLEEFKKMLEVKDTPKNRPETKLELLEDKRFEALECKIVNVRFDPEDKFVAAACDDGVLRVYDVKTCSLFAKFAVGEDGESLLNLKWRPFSSTVKTKYVLACSDSTGNLFHIHVTTNKILHQLKEKDNQIYGLDYNCDASQFATAGLDCAVRIYDENKKSMSVELKMTDQAPGHSNRVFSVKFSNNNPNILLSGGWDRTIQIWDTRLKKGVSSFYGPEIAGDAIDFRENDILTGSWRDSDQIQLWDIRNTKKPTTIPWDHNPKVVKDTFVYTAQFGKTNSNYIIAGSSGTNEVRIFSRKDDGKVVKAYNNSNKGCFCVDFSSKDSSFAYGGNKGSIGICSLKA